MAQVSEKNAKTGTSASDDADFGVPASNPEAFGRLSRLKEAVRAAGGNQVVAERSGVSLSTLNRYLSGGEMKVANAVALARAVDVSLEWLLAGSGDMRPGVQRTGRAQRNPPPESLEQTELRLTQSVNVDQLVEAFGQAWETLKASGHLQDVRLLMHLMLANYDILTRAKAGRAGGSEHNPQDYPQKDPQET